jgi:hypothetical protein
VGSESWRALLRWGVTLKPVRADPRRGTLFSATVIGSTPTSLWGRRGEADCPYLIATKEQVSISRRFGNASTALFTECPVSPGRKAGRGVRPRLPRGKSFNHGCDYFSRACGIWIGHSTACVGGGVQVGLGGSGTDRASRVRARRWPRRSLVAHGLTFVVVVPAVLMLAVGGFEWHSLRRIGREVSM